MTSEIKQRTVYKLVRTDKPEDGADVYVGSTSGPLRERLWNHRTYAKKENSKLYKRMLEIGVYNWEIIPLLQRTCNKETILHLERKCCEKLHTDLNTVSPITTSEEKKQQKVEYYALNKKTIRQYQAAYYKSNKEVIKQQGAGYRESNKEIIKQRRAGYRESNKRDKIHYCELCKYACGSNSDLKKHLKTEKHKDKNFDQLIDGVHKMIQEGTFSRALENSKETTL